MSQTQVPYELQASIHALMDAFLAQPSQVLLRGLEGLARQQILTQGLWPETGKKLVERVHDADFDDPVAQPFLADALARLSPPKAVEVLRKRLSPPRDPRWASVLSALGLRTVDLRLACQTRPMELTDAPAGSHAELLQAIEANDTYRHDYLRRALAVTDDDALRVLSDELLEEGHPLAELLAFGLSASAVPSRKLAALRRQAARLLLPRVSFLAKSLTWKNGLPHTAALHAGAMEQLPSLEDEPGLATLGWLTIDRLAQLDRVLAHARGDALAMNRPPPPFTTAVRSVTCWHYLAADRMTAPVSGDRWRALQQRVEGFRAAPGMLLISGPDADRIQEGLESAGLGRPYERVGRAKTPTWVVDVREGYRRALADKDVWRLCAAALATGATVQDGTLALGPINHELRGLGPWILGELRARKIPGRPPGAFKRVTADALAGPRWSDVRVVSEHIEWSLDGLVHARFCRDGRVDLALWATLSKDVHSIAVPVAKRPGWFTWFGDPGPYWILQSAATTRLARDCLKVSKLRCEEAILAVLNGDSLGLDPEEVAEIRAQERQIRNLHNHVRWVGAPRSLALEAARSEAPGELRLLPE